MQEVMADRGETPADLFGRPVRDVFLELVDLPVDVVAVREQVPSGMVAYRLRSGRRLAHRQDGLARDHEVHLLVEETITLGVEYRDESPCP